MSLIESLKTNEGYRGMPYKCAAGKDTIGYGCRLPLSKKESELILRYRLYKTKRQLAKRLSDVWYSFPKNVKEVLLEMAYQMGVAGLFKFKNTMVFIRSMDFDAASKEMLDSQWARRYKTRAIKLSNKMAGK
jgi:lysozyme